MQTSNPFYDVLRWSCTNHRVRASWYLACEMDGEQEEALDIYYGRLLKLISFQVDVDSVLSGRWGHWQETYEVGVFDWVAGMEIGAQRQIFKNCVGMNAFSANSVEDLSIIRRLIAVVDHNVPSAAVSDSSTRSRSTVRRGRRRCYFADDNAHLDALLDSAVSSDDGKNRRLRGIRGQ